MITDWIRSIIIYMLLVSVLLHLLPEESYRKYVRLAVGLLLLLIVIEPVSRLFSDGNVSDFLTEKLPEEAWAGQEELFRQEAEAAQEQALCKAYETQVRESVTQHVQAQGYILREAEIEVTAEGVQKIELRLAADAAKEANETQNTAGKTNEVGGTAEETNETQNAAEGTNETQNTAGKTNEVRDTAEETNETQNAAGGTNETRNTAGKANEVRDTAEETNETRDTADVEAKGEASGCEDSIQQQEKRLRAELCEQYALEEQAVSVMIDVE